MKNQYFGDIGDYSKFVLISQLLRSGLKLGLNWYLTKNDGKTDGKHIDYLNKQDYYNSDTELCDFLKKSINEDSRNIAETRSFERFKDIKFYEDLLDIEDISGRTPVGRNVRVRRREDWFSSSLMELSDVDIIFCDPDNGIASQKMKLTGKNSVKFVFLDEIEKMIDAGFSLVVYNHRDRSKEEYYLERIRNSYKGENDIKTRIIRFNRYSVRDYILLIQKDHQEKLEASIDEFLNDERWNKQFKEIKNARI